MPDRLGAVFSGYDKGIKKSVFITDFFISAYRLQCLINDPKGNIDAFLNGSGSSIFSESNITIEVHFSVHFYIRTDFDP